MGGQKIDFIQEYCLLMTRDCFSGINGFMEELPQIGNAFIMTLKAQTLGYKPQVMKNNILHHYRIFSLDVNEFERMTEKAMNSLPKIVCCHRVVVQCKQRVEKKTSCIYTKPYKNDPGYNV